MLSGKVICIFKELHLLAWVSREAEKMILLRFVIHYFQQRFNLVLVAALGSQQGDERGFSTLLTMEGIRRYQPIEFSAFG